MNGITIEYGKRITSRWGQWYQHNIVKLNGVEIGRIQVRRRYWGPGGGHSIETHTLDNSNHCVIGNDVNWLVRQQTVV